MKKLILSLFISLSFITVFAQRPVVGVVASSIQNEVVGGGGTGTVTFVNTNGDPVEGTTTLSVPLPSSRVVGNIMLLFVSNKYPPNGATSTPSGWSTFTNYQSDNTGLTAGAAAGNTRTTVFYRIIDGSESGNVSVDMASGNVALGWTMQFSKSDGTWQVGGAKGADDTHDDATNITLNTDPGFTTGDMAVSCLSINATSGTAVLGESATLTVPGVTLGAAVGETNSTSSGDDIRTFFVYQNVTDGTSSGAASYTHDILTSSAASMVLVRLRAAL